MVRLGGPDESFEFIMGNSFFATVEGEDWDGGEIVAGVSMSKSAGVITLEFQLKGFLNIMCDRCLEYYAQNIDSTQLLFIKYGEERQEIDENVLIITRDEHQVDISQFLLEFLILALPLKKVHKDNPDGSTGCNKTMIEKLEKHLIKEVDSTTDPRWDELKKLKDKN